MLGRTIGVDDGHLVMTPILGPAERLVPVDEGLFRREGDLAASLAFIETGDGMALAGGRMYAERRVRWPIEVLRGLLILALALVAASPLAAAGLLWRWREPRARWTTATWLAAGGALGVAAWAAWTASPADLGVVGGRSTAIYAGTAIHPWLAIGLIVVAVSWRDRPRVASVAGAIAGAHLGLAAYLTWWGIFALQTWNY